MSNQFPFLPVLSQINIFNNNIKRCLLLIIRNPLRFQLNNSISKGALSPDYYAKHSSLNKVQSRKRIKHFVCLRQEDFYKGLYCIHQKCLRSKDIQFMPGGEPFIYRYLFTQNAGRNFSPVFLFLANDGIETYVPYFVL